MSNNDQGTDKNKSGTERPQGKPTVPDPGKNPDFPVPETGGSGGGIKISAD